MTPPSAPSSPTADNSAAPARTEAQARAQAQARRAGWLKQLHQWHWISSALCLIGMLLFSFTGITLNHAADIEARPQVTRRNAQLPPDLQRALEGVEATGRGKQADLPPAVHAWLVRELALPQLPTSAEWSADEVYAPMPRPGGDAWLRIARDSGEVEFERTDRGWIAYLNDLHKARHTGWAWRWFIDIFAGACLLFSITGLLILKFHAVARPITWPLVGLGLVVPLLLALLLIH